MIRDVRDSFAHFLYDNLTDIPVHFLRKDSSDSAAVNLKKNAVNVEYDYISLDTVAKLTAYIDILQEDDNTAVDWLEAVWNLLSSAFMIPIYDYTNTSSPVLVGANVMWDHNSVKFRKVNLQGYTQYSCSLPLRFTAINN